MTEGCVRLPAILEVLCPGRPGWAQCGPQSPQVNTGHHWSCLLTGSSPDPCSHSNGYKCNWHTQTDPPLKHACGKIRHKQRWSIQKWQLHVLSNLLIYNTQIHKKRVWITRSRSHMAFMLSVRLASNVRNCLPFLVYPLTSEPKLTKIFSCGVPKAPPSSSLEIFCPGSDLNTGWQKDIHLLSQWEQHYYFGTQ